MSFEHRDSFLSRLFFHCRDTLFVSLRFRTFLLFPFVAPSTSLCHYLPLCFMFSDYFFCFLRGSFPPLGLCVCTISTDFLDSFRRHHLFAYFFYYFFVSCAIVCALWIWFLFADLGFAKDSFLLLFFPSLFPRLVFLARFSHAHGRSHNQKKFVANVHHTC